MPNEGCPILDRIHHYFQEVRSESDTGRCGTYPRNGEVRSRSKRGTPSSWCSNVRPPVPRFLTAFKSHRCTPSLPHSFIVFCSSGVKDTADQVRGMAYSGSGMGGILLLETTLVPGGKGRLVLTGSLGDVIKESAELGLTWVKSRSVALGITGHQTEDPLKGVDIHVSLDQLSFTYSTPAYPFPTPHSRNPNIKSRPSSQ